MTEPATCATAVPVVTDRPSVGLEVGRDPSGVTWLVVRYADDWSRAVLDGLRYDATRGVVELVQVPPAGLTRPTRLPLQTVIGPDGLEYRSRPSRHQVERRVPGASTWMPLPGFGGRGRALGQLRSPQGLATDRSRLYVADSRNHRVQVVRLADATVVDALGRRDAWGAYGSGFTGGAMMEPVDVDVHLPSARIAVADRAAGRIHVFDGKFRWCRSFELLPALPRPDGLGPLPVALTFEASGSLLVADARWPRLLRVDTQGRLVAEVPLSDTDAPRFEGLSLGVSYRTEGTATLGPLDSGTHAVAWHDVRVEGATPDGTAIEVQTWASDDPTATPPAERWAPPAPVPITGLHEAEPGDTRVEESRLVQSDGSEWQAWLQTDRSTPVPLGTDRGRYLWVRVRLMGRKSRPTSSTATETPSLGSLRLRFPRPSWLQWLPASWSRRDANLDPAGALFVERFLSLFEGVLSHAEAKLEGLPRLVSAQTAPSGWLEWVASWLALSFDPSWPEERRRALLVEAMALYRKRGTRWGLSRYVEIYTGSEPVIVEGFTTRGTRQPLVLGQPHELGCEVLDATSTTADLQAHRFVVYVLLDPAQREVMEPVVRRILDLEKPAHTDYDLIVVTPDARVGCQSTVGIDFVLGHGASSIDGLPVLTGPGGSLLDDVGVAVGDLRLT